MTNPTLKDGDDNFLRNKRVRLKWDLSDVWWHNSPWMFSSSYSRGVKAIHQKKPLEFLLDQIWFPQAVMTLVPRWSPLPTLDSARWHRDMWSVRGLDIPCQRHWAPQAAKSAWRCHSLYMIIIDNLIILIGTMIIIQTHINTIILYWCSML